MVVFAVVDAGSAVSDSTLFGGVMEVWAEGAGATATVACEVDVTDRGLDAVVKGVDESVPVVEISVIRSNVECWLPLWVNVVVGRELHIDYRRAVEHYRNAGRAALEVRFLVCVPEGNVGPSSGISILIARGIFVSESRTNGSTWGDPKFNRTSFNFAIIPVALFTVVLLNTIPELSM